MRPVVTCSLFLAAAASLMLGALLLGTGCPIFGGESCSDTCATSDDGECDDGGAGALYDICGLGTDCSDCGSRGGGTGGAGGDDDDTGGGGCSGGVSRSNARPGDPCGGGIGLCGGNDYQGYPVKWRCDMETCTWEIAELCDGHPVPSCNVCDGSTCLQSAAGSCAQ